MRTAFWATIAMVLMVTPTVLGFNTFFVELISVADEKFAAIAAISKEFTIRNAVLWFNDQKLIPEQVQEACFAGNVQVTSSGNLRPEMVRAMTGTVVDYVESYEIVDPNDQMWHIDVYNYQRPAQQPMHVFIVDTGSCLTEPTLEEFNFDENQPDGDPTRPTEVGDGLNDYDDGCLGQAGTERPFTRNMTSCQYNAVVLVRLAYFLAADVTADGESHNETLDDCSQVDTGYSHECDQGAPGADPDPSAHHFHDTARFDLFFETSRPPPSNANVVIQDAVGSAAAFDEHPCTRSATGFAPGGGCPDI